MSDLKIADSGDGFDLVLEDGDVVLFGADELTAEVAQRVVYTVMTWQGESPYDLAAGLPYLDGIFGFEPVPGVAGLITQAIADTDGVAELDENPAYELETTTRELSINVRIRVTGDSEFLPLSLEVASP